MKAKRNVLGGRWLIVFILLLLSWEGKATGLSGDVIYLQGEEWVLLDKPIHRDSILFHRLVEFLPENHCITTANWEGYTAYWEVLFVNGKYTIEFNHFVLSIWEDKLKPSQADDTTK